MLRTIIGIVIFLALLAVIPYIWPTGFSEPPVAMITLLAVAALVAVLAGRKRRARGWGTRSGA
jgi:hypothetical protein